MGLSFCGWACGRIKCGHPQHGAHDIYIRTNNNVDDYPQAGRLDWRGRGRFARHRTYLLFFLYLDHRDPPSSIYNAVYRPH